MKKYWSRTQRRLESTLRKQLDDLVERNLINVDAGERRNLINELPANFSTRSQWLGQRKSITVDPREFVMKLEWQQSEGRHVLTWV